ncbi:MAG TPA: hypothetical protein VGH38_12170, partial [Bryobacteraceae bacterium]
GRGTAVKPEFLVVAPGWTVDPPAGAVLVVFGERLETPSDALLSRCAEVVVVRRSGGFLALRAAVQQSVKKWRPAAAQLHGSEMARCAADCAPAKTTIVGQSA